MDLNGVWKMDWVTPETRKRESERKRGAELKEDEKKPCRWWIRPKKVRKEFLSIQRHPPPPLGSRRDPAYFNATR